MDITNMMKNFLILGDMRNYDSKEEKLKYEEKIVFSTMKSKIPDWQPPRDWDKISIDEKLTRLEKIKNI